MSLYAKGQLVWAKIKGYPWWPGVVELVAKTNQDKNQVIEKEILVNFIGENSHAVLTQDKVADFEEKFKQFSTGKNKKLQDSIRLAQKILSGATSYEEEREKLEKQERLERNQQKHNQEEVKPSNRGRATSRKKSESITDSQSGGGKDKDVTPKAKETTPKSKDSVQKEKGVLHRVKEESVNEAKKVETPQKEKGAATTTSTKDKEVSAAATVAQKEKASPKQKQGKEGKLTAKQRNKKTEKEMKTMRTEALQDFLPFRITRSQARGNDGMHFDERSSNSKNKDKSHKNDSASKSSNRRENGAAATTNKYAKETKETAGARQGKMKGKLLIDEDEASESNSRRNRRMSSHSEENTSPSKLSERKFSGGRNDFEEEKIAASHLNAETSVSRASEGNKMDLEPTTNVFKALEAANSSTADSLTSKDNLNKRSNSNILRDSPPIYTSHIKEIRDGKNEEGPEYEEFIMKKQKMGTFAGMDEGKDTKAVGAYNVLMIQKLENDLGQILHGLSLKFQTSQQGNEKLKENDVEMMKLLNIIEEFENKTFDGSEFTNSDLGKIFKTIHFLLIKNKARLPKTGDLVITALAKVVHKIKDKIIKFCLDNSQYLETLQLPQENEGPKQITMAAIDIDFEEIKAKIEELGDETKVEPVPIQTKVEEEESTSANSQAQKQQLVQSLEQRNNALAGAATHQQQANNSSALTVPPNTRDIHREAIKESPSIKQHHSHQEMTANDLGIILRKKICQKLAKLLQRTYRIGKEESQQMTLSIEDKLNKFFGGSINEYKQSIKALHKLIKNQSLALAELTRIQTMSLGQFKHMLDEKLPDLAKAQNDLQSYEREMETDDITKKEPPLADEGSAPFDFQAYLTAKIDSDRALNDTHHRGETSTNEQMVTEPPNPFIQDLFQTKEEE